MSQSNLSNILGIEDEVNFIFEDTIMKVSYDGILKYRLSGRWYNVSDSKLIFRLISNPDNIEICSKCNSIILLGKYLEGFRLMFVVDSEDLQDFIVFSPTLDNLTEEQKKEPITYKGSECYVPKKLLPLDIVRLVERSKKSGVKIERVIDTAVLSRLNNKGYLPSYISGCEYKLLGRNEK